MSVEVAPCPSRPELNRPAFQPHYHRRRACLKQTNTAPLADVCLQYRTASLAQSRGFRTCSERLRRAQRCVLPPQAPTTKQTLQGPGTPRQAPRTSHSSQEPADSWLAGPGPQHCAAQGERWAWCVCCVWHTCAHNEASPPGGQPPPHAVTVEHPLLPHDAASEAQHLAVLGGVCKGAAGGRQNGGVLVRCDLRGRGEGGDRDRREKRDRR